MIPDVLADFENRASSVSTAKEDIGASSRRETREPRGLALLALTAAVFGLCIMLAAPFFPAITWGVALAIMAWPMHRWIGRSIRWPAVAAFVSTAIVTFVISTSAGFVVYQLAQETGSAAELLQERNANGGIRATLEEVPLLNRVVVWMDNAGLDVETEVRKIVSSYTQDINGLAQGSFSVVLQVLVAIFILFHLFLDRAQFLHAFRDLLPMSRAECERIITSAADSVHANLYATLVTSVIDTVTGGLMFWMIGLSAPVLWAVVMFVLSILPIVGAGLVWFPAVVYLAISGRGLAAAALLAWGIASFIVVDNFLYARLAGQRMRMHVVPALIAFLGGIAVFGVSGIILGPVILALALAFLDIWKQRIAAGSAS